MNFQSAATTKPVTFTNVFNNTDLVDIDDFTYEAMSTFARKNNNKLLELILRHI